MVIKNPYLDGFYFIESFSYKYHLIQESYLYNFFGKNQLIVFICNYFLYICINKIHYEYRKN
jgi:hypothetical protein